MTSRIKNRVAAIGAALLLCPLAGQSRAAAAERLVLEPCRPRGLEADVRCGTFHVPENRDRPNGRRLPLRVIVIPARAAQPSEPIFYLAGGPGAAATDEAGPIAASWMREDHDVVLVDQRGTGEGHRLDCPVHGGLQGNLEPVFSEGVRLRACREALETRADLSQYSTPQAMTDLDEARRALGYGRINLAGRSYGTRAALVYIRMYGAHVRAAFLGGLAPFENRNPLYHAAAAQRAFDKLAAQCAADTACNGAFPHVREDLAAILERLRTEPARVRADDPATGESGEVVLTASGFGDGLRVMLYSAELGRRVPRLLSLARAGDLAPFAQAALTSGYALRSALALGLTLSVTCSEDVARIRAGDVAPATAGSFVGDQRVRGQMAACSVWPRARLPRDYSQRFRSSVPVVLVSGDLDAVTPPEWGEAMARYFPNSLHVVTPYSHADQSQCIEAIGRALFRSGSARGLDTGCIAALSLAPFETTGPPNPR